MINKRRRASSNEPPAKRNAPEPRDYRKKRSRTDSVWAAFKTPEQVETVKELITFAYTYQGNSIDVQKIKNIVPHLQELDRLIGLEQAKRTIVRLIKHYTQGGHRKNRDYLHMKVCGPPGTGKTTLCEIWGKILSGIGMLPTKKFYKVKRTDLVAKYLGQTAHKTKDFLEDKCLGGVMFIDEAYSLAPRDSDRDSFAKEVIDFLNQFLSEHKDDLVCIIAGYEEELAQTFFAMNPGLESRFPMKLTIEGYDEADLLKMFYLMTKDQDLQVDSDAINVEFFKKNKSDFKYFGRDIENFVSKCKFANSDRTFGKSGPRHLLSAADIKAGFSEHAGTHKKTSEPPPHFYI